MFVFKQYLIRAGTLISDILPTTNHNKNTTTRTFQIAGKNQVKKFLDWLYIDSELYINRKYNLYLSKYHPELLNDSLTA